MPSKAETITNEIDVDNVFESICSTIISDIQKSLGKGFGWIIDTVVDHTINISKYKPLSGSSYPTTERIRPSEKRFDYYLKY